MSMRKPLLVIAMTLLFGAGAALAQSPGLGKPVSEADIKAWDIAVLPDGTNLPPGSGTPAQGAKIYAEKCVACHAEGGKGGAGPGAGPLVGGEPLTNGIDTVKTIANYYAYATTVFDYIRRAMPYNAPRSLADNEVYHAHSLHSLPQQADRRKRRDGRQDPAAGEDAQPRQLDHALSRSDLKKRLNRAP